jgi:hypothetical protein
MFKGGGMRWPVSRILSTRAAAATLLGETIIYLGLPSPTASSGLPAPPRLDTDAFWRATLSALSAVRRCLALHPPGFT